jgi:hypothetical protein
MKQKDIALVVVIGLIGAIISLLVSNMLFSAPSKRQTSIEVVQTFTADFPTPDKRYFNSDAVNPTKIISIDKNVNQAPFGSSTAPQ